MAHQMLKPYSFLLYGLVFIFSFFVGVTYAGIVEAGKNQGLAGGAIVLGYGVIAACIGLLISLIIANKTNKKIIFRLNIILAICIVGFYAYYHIKYLERQKAKELENPKTEQPQQKTSPKTVVPEGEPITMAIHLLDTQAVEQNDNSGLGMFTLNFSEQDVLYFYGNPHLEKSLQEHIPYDSITFKKSQYGGHEIATAPPWLVPDHLKLDYDMLYFKVQSVTQYFVEVTVNTKTNQTSFVSRFSGQIVYWPDFLLSVHSVEFPNPESETIYIKPLDHAGKVNIAYSFMRPLQIKQEWMYVELQNDGFQPIGKGWIKWQKNGKLLIRYSLLS